MEIEYVAIRWQSWQAWLETKNWQTYSPPPWGASIREVGEKTARSRHGSTSFISECLGTSMSNNPSQAAPSLLRQRAPHHPLQPNRRLLVLRRAVSFALVWSQQVRLHVRPRIELHAVGLEPLRRIGGRSGGHIGKRVAQETSRK